MEDRQPTGLLLETIAADDAEEAARWQRGATPAALHGGRFVRATRFRNLLPGQSRFRPRIPEFTHLTVFEIDRPDVDVGALPRADGVEVHRYCFRRYPRPSQGICTGNPLSGLYLILISPKERARAQALRDWADFVHLHYIAAARPRGYTMITPYENAKGDDPLFMHLYELETDDPVKATEEMTAQVCAHRGFPFDVENEEFRQWAFHDALDIWYVNTFARVDD